MPEPPALRLIRCLSLTSFDVNAAFDQACTGRGTCYLSEWEVLELLGFATAKGYLVQSMEATRLDSDGDTPMIEYSLLGLEPLSEWGACDDPRALSGLVKEKLLAAQAEARPMRYQIWLRCI